MYSRKKIWIRKLMGLQTIPKKVQIIPNVEHRLAEMVQSKKKLNTA